MFGAMNPPSLLEVGKTDVRRYLNDSEGKGHPEDQV
jgi:hypothetical protein